MDILKRIGVVGEVLEKLIEVFFTYRKLTEDRKSILLTFCISNLTQIEIKRIIKNLSVSYG